MPELDPLALALVGLIVALFVVAALVRNPPKPTNGMPVRTVMDLLELYDARITALEDQMIAAYQHVDSIYTSLSEFQEGRGWVAGFKERDPRRRPPGKGTNA